MTKMTTLVAGAAMLIAAAQVAPVMAQESSYTPGTVWEVGRIDVLPGQFENNLDYLATTWKKVQELGKKADQKVRDEVAKDYIMDTPMVNSEIFITNTSEALFLDSMTGRYFTSDMQSVRSAVNDVNEEIIKFNTCSQNDFYARIGLPPVRFGEEQGWNTSQMLEVNYSTQLAEDNRPCIVLEYLSHPIRGYYKESSY